MEVLIVVGLVATLTGIAVPSLRLALQRYRTHSAGREVAGVIRAARLAAVTTNRTMIVRFNCPGARQYRFIEFTGNAAIDNAADRCAAAWPDPDPATLPNNDGPPMYLPENISFGAVQGLRIAPTGVITPLTGGMPALIEVTDGSMVGQLTVSAAGRVQLPQ